MNVTQLSEDEIYEVQRKMNDHPCKVMNINKPNEIFNNYVALII